MEVKEQVTEKKKQKKENNNEEKHNEDNNTSNVIKVNNFIKRQKDLNVCNNVIYKILCNVCDALYVSQTKRLKTTGKLPKTSNLRFL